MECLGIVCCFSHHPSSCGPGGLAQRHFHIPVFHLERFSVPVSFPHLLGTRIATSSFFLLVVRPGATGGFLLPVAMPFVAFVASCYVRSDSLQPTCDGLHLLCVGTLLGTSSDRKCGSCAAALVPLGRWGTGTGHQPHGAGGDDKDKTT